MLPWKYNEELYSLNSNDAYVCFLTNTQYVPGVLVLAHSLCRVLSCYPLYVVVPIEMEKILTPLFSPYGIHVISITSLHIDPSLVARSVVTDTLNYWENTFFKLQVSKLQQFRKVVLLDADMIVVKNIDHLFQSPHMSAVAAGQIKHSHWVQLNSGLMVVVPDSQFEQLLSDNIHSAFSSLLAENRSFGDQDIFNFCYPNWPAENDLHLPETYNAMSDCINSISQKYGFRNIHIAHFIGKCKPWNRDKSYVFSLFKEALKQMRFSEFRLFMKYYFTLKKISFSMEI